jgi:hypothetical protein
MADYPGAIDSASSLYTPVNAFSGTPLETTTTVLVGDSTINVASTSGFAASYGILSIDGELVVYAGKTATQFSRCQRGAFGTGASGHGNGVAVSANMVAGFITALQSAVLAIENDLGTAAARNYIRKDGAVTVTGLKTFQDGVEFGAGTKAATGLARLPNAGAIKWRKQDNSGDLGMALNGNDHLAMDAIIDFAAGQTFGAFSYPDATTAAKGIVQIDAVGGLAVAGGVVSIADTAVMPGAYPKVTVDQKGRVTAGALLLAGDLPSHTHTASDIVSGSLPFKVQKAGADVGTRRALNFTEGANIGLTVADDAGNDRVNVTVALSSVPAHVHAEADVTNLVTDLPGKAPISHNHDASNIDAGTLALERGGVGASPSGTGPDFLKQTGVGAAVTVAALASGDLPSHTHTSAQISDVTAARDREHGGPARWVGRRELRVRRRQQPVGVPRLALPVRRVRGIRNHRRCVREHGEVLRRLHRCHLGQKWRVMLGERERRRRARWEHDRGPDHRQHRHADHSAAGRGPHGRRYVHVLRLGQGRVRNQERIDRHREQCVRRVPRWSHADRAHNRVATIPDHRHAGGRPDRPVDRGSPV